MIARAVEARGIPTMVMGSAFDILSSCWPPRTSFVNYPLGHQTGKAFDQTDQYRLVEAALDGLALLKKPGQVNVLECDWGNTMDLNEIIGGREVVLRRDTVIKYQCQESLDLAVARHGEADGGGIVSKEAIRQREALG